MSRDISGVVTDDEGELHWLGGISARLLLGGDATGGRFSVVGFVLGDDAVTAEPGMFVRKPRNQWHTFYNAGDTEARLLELISPAGFERYFEELAHFFPADGPPTSTGWPRPPRGMGCACAWTHCRSWSSASTSRRRPSWTLPDPGRRMPAR